MLKAIKTMYLFATDWDNQSLAFFKKNREAITPTQWAALDKGTVGFEGSIFKGKPDWKALMARPAPSLTPEEQSFLDNETEELCSMIDDWKVREELKDLEPRVWDYLKTKGFFGLVISKDYGGKGFSAQGHAAIVSKIASRCATAGATSMVPNSLGPGELLAHYGTDEQKNHYLPRLANGRDIPCFALTSPQAGSDATNQADEGTVFKGDDNKLYIRMNWDKRYTTLAPVATVIGVAFNLKDPDNLLGGGEDRGITLALVPANTPGVDNKHRHRPPYPFMNGPHWGRDVIVPVDAIIGGEKQAGNGWNMLVDCLSIGRAISLPAGASGLAKYALRVTTAYAAVRKQFNSRLADMGGIQEQIGKMAALTYSLDAARMGPLQDMDLDETHSTRPAVSSAILKYHTTEASRVIADAAVEIHGGKGVVEGPENPVSHLRHTIPVSTTVEGANIMTRNLMIFGQGVFVGHPYVLKEMKTVETGDAKEAGRLFRLHLKHAFTNAARGLFHGVTAGYLTSTPEQGPGAPFQRQINRMSAQFATLAEVSMALLGPKLVREERISARHGDILSHLYLASLTLRRFNYEGSQKDDIPLMQRAVQHHLYEAEHAMEELIRNHPSILVRGLRRIFHPVSWTDKPRDYLDKKITETICQPSATRDRLTAGLFMPTAQSEYMTRLEKALNIVAEAAPHEATLARAQKKGLLKKDVAFVDMVEEAADLNIINADARDLLHRAQAARDDIIKVNHFPMEWAGPAMTPGNSGPANDSTRHEIPQQYPRPYNP
ncbi:MAG: acyl-CoA dehydrogenase [Alphaproteobacteria bacterium]|nr:acyl-CoA dehydrogenase [Alphaproteobacteria bacterium]